MRKSPYTFPHKTRAAMTAYLSDHESYVPMNTWNGGFVLAWNIKAYSFDETGRGAPTDYPVQSRFDDAWRQHLDENPEMFWEVCSDAVRHYADGEWTNYPGIEQGEWKFSTNGRSGGYLILTNAPTWCPAPYAWRAFPMIWGSRGAYEDWLANLRLETLRKFYRAIRVLDHDTRPEARNNELSYQFAFRRHEWEQELIEAENCDARAQEVARPDLYEERRA